MIYLCDYKKNQLFELVSEYCPEKYRVNQIWDWIYKKKAVNFSDMKNLPEVVRSRLKNADLDVIPIKVAQTQESSDGTVKLLLSSNDGMCFESVVIPGKSRCTLCVSTQIGCPLGCSFCATGQMGFKRNLSVSEIIGQVLISSKYCMAEISNIVFMGMGEPLLNLENVLAAIQIMNDKDGLNIGARKITISTAGLPDKIRALSSFPLQVRLSISLHAPDDEKRNLLMPVNKNFGLDLLLNSIKEYVEKTGRRVTFEYLLIKDVNDSVEDAVSLSKIACKICHSVNIIPYNSVIFQNFNNPDDIKVRQFCSTLISKGVRATVRKSRGADIDAACGQLACCDKKD